MEKLETLIQKLLDTIPGALRGLDERVATLSMELRIMNQTTQANQEDIRKISHALFEGNGQPSMVARQHILEMRQDELRHDHEGLRTEMAGRFGEIRASIQWIRDRVEDERRHDEDRRWQLMLAMLGGGGVAGGATAWIMRAMGAG